MLHILSVLLLLGSLGHAKAPDVAAQVALQVALSDVGPFAYKESGSIRGINYDILNELSKKSGLNFEYRLYPHVRLKNALPNVSPDITILFSAACKKFSDAYEIQSKLYTAKPTLFLKNSVNLQDDRIRVGLVRGTCSDLSKRYFKPQMITDISDMTQAIDMMASGRLEGVCGLAPVVRFGLERKKTFTEKIVSSHTDSEVLEAVICRKKNLSPEIKKKLDEAAKNIKIPNID
jgi:ABC-type amino acid transport substrate-binding protein